MHAERLKAEHEALKRRLEEERLARERAAAELERIQANKALLAREADAAASRVKGCVSALG